MSTRGFLGIRNNKELITGKFNHWDSYYDNLGQEVLNLYYDNKGKAILELSEETEEDTEFIKDGLFCEYAYVYNQDNDTLEVYRGFFKIKQNADGKEQNVKEQIVEALEQGNDKYHCHLILIIDKKKNKKEDVLKAFAEYTDNEDDDKKDYPEHDIIKLKLPKDYIFIV